MEERVLLLCCKITPQYQEYITEKRPLARNVLMYLIYACRVGRIILDIFAEAGRAQIHVSYNPARVCDAWLQSVLEVFVVTNHHGDHSQEWRLHDGWHPHFWVLSVQPVG